jgi:uncharacterized protein (DUF433 family)
MAALRDIESLLPQLTFAERAQLLQWVARDLGGASVGIESQADICGGSARIVRTRIPVWLLVQAQSSGMSEAQILQAYPTLRAEDLVNAWAYARLHVDDILREIQANEDA